MRFSIFLALIVSYAISVVDMSSVPAQIAPNTEVATTVKIDELDRARKVEITTSEPTATIDVIDTDITNKETDFKIKAPASGSFELTIRALLDDGSVVEDSKTISSHTWILIHEHSTTVNAGSTKTINLSSSARNYLSNLDNYSEIKLVVDLTQNSNSCGYPHSTQLRGSIGHGCQRALGGSTSSADSDVDYAWKISDLSSTTKNILKNATDILHNRHWWYNCGANRAGCKSGVIHSYKIYLKP